MEYLKNQGHRNDLLSVISISLLFGGAWEIELFYIKTYSTMYFICVQV